MPKFRALIKGGNVLLDRLSGFYVTAFVEAESVARAQASALSLVRESHVLAAARNDSTNPPRIEIEEIEAIIDWPADTKRPLTGFALYDEQSSTNEHANI
jgi:hypothetical protein